MLDKTVILSIELIRRMGVNVNVNVGGEAHVLYCHATPKINFCHLKQPLPSHFLCRFTVYLTTDTSHNLQHAMRT